VTLPFDPATLRIPAAVAMLDNGLRVVAHLDRKSPIVAVHIAYRAGSREEPPGKYGLAHLFEHLMFSGSEHSPENYFIPMERIGAAWINAHAADDYAAYFAAVPTAALDYALWMEAERMGCLAAALNQAALDRQREVVRNELLQREAEPYGRAAGLIRSRSYPDHHPYSHHPYGRIEELDNISLEDALGWYETYYSPANATLVIAGDIEPMQAIENAGGRFGAISGGAVGAQRKASVAQPSRESRLVLEEDRSPSRIYRVWNVAALGSPECAALEVVCELLAGGAPSRLFKRLVERELASGVSIELQGRELGSQIVLSATAAQGSRLVDLESELDAEFSRFVSEFPSAQDCASAYARIASRFMRGAERVCGPSSKSDLLARAMLASADPDTATASLRRIASLDAAQIRRAPPAGSPAPAKWPRITRRRLTSRDRERLRIHGHLPRRPRGRFPGRKSRKSDWTMACGSSPLSVRARASSSCAWCLRTARPRRVRQRAA